MNTEDSVSQSAQQTDLVRLNSICADSEVQEILCQVHLPVEGTVHILSNTVEHIRAQSVRKYKATLMASTKHPYCIGHRPDPSLP